MRAVSPMSWAIGFSLQTALPARSAASISAAWVLGRRGDDDRFDGRVVDRLQRVASTRGPHGPSSRPVAAAASALGSATTTTRALGIGGEVAEVGLAHPRRPQGPRRRSRSRPSAGRSQQVAPREREAVLVPVARLVHVVLAADLGNGHVPPALHARDTARGGHPDHDDRGPVAAARTGKRSADLVGRSRTSTATAPIDSACWR